MGRAVIRRLGPALALLAAWVPALVVAAEEPQAAAPPSGAASAPLSAELVKTGLYLISGGGSNTLLRLSASGNILVDGKLPGQYRPLMSQLRRINKLSDLPTRVLIVTNHHGHHTGNQAQFQAAGVAVLAQQNALRRLPPAVAGTASGAKQPAPLIPFDRHYELRMGGVEVQVFHFGSGLTDNDAVVWFPDLKVIAVGDLLSTGAPSADLAAGGSLRGWSTALAEVLKLDFDVVVPGTGPLATRADLQALKARLDRMASADAAPEKR